MSRGRAKDAQLVVRVPEELIEQLDAYAEKLRAQQPGPAWSRADVVRMLLAQALGQASSARRARR